MEIKWRWQMFFLGKFSGLRHLCTNWLLFLFSLGGMANLHARTYYGPTIYPPDNTYKDESQKSLMHNFQNAIYGRNIVVIQPYYNNFGGNLANFQLTVGVGALATFSISALFPKEFEAELELTERRMVQVYESFMRKVLKLNPWPGTEFVLYVRSPAFPFLYLASIDQLALDKKIFPFMDDERGKSEKVKDRQFGLAFSIQIW